MDSEPTGQHHDGPVPASAERGLGLLSGPCLTDTSAALGLLCARYDRGRWRSVLQAALTGPTAVQDADSGTGSARSDSRAGPGRAGVAPSPDRTASE
jgi:hypothetical protein